MKPVITAGWLTGLLLLLAGWPWPAALAVPVAITTGAVTFRWWGARVRGCWLAVRVHVKIRQAAARKTGGAVERA